MQDDLTTIDAGDAGAAPEAPRAFIARIEGAAPTVTELPLGESLSLGRSRSSGLTVDDSAVSRLHATVRWEGGSTARLIDHGSRNGTFLNGQRVEGTAELTSGAEIALGSTHLVVALRPARAAGAPGADQPEPIAKAPAMLRALALAERAARTEATVLLVGETGVGKEVFARHIHALSRRSAGPFVAVNSGAINAALAESALFGHEPGAFTGAAQRHVGYFEQAHRGSLLLDEVGELEPAMQVKLLRVIQERVVVRLGSTRPRKVDCRLLAATNADLAELTRSGRLREDLLYRLDVMRIEIPPLRDRPDDVAPLAERFLEQLDPRGLVRLEPGALEALRARRWPGNVRQLRNVLERSLALRRRDTLGARDLVDDEAASPSPAGTLRDTVDGTERDAIVAALEACGGNQTRAAKRLGISRRSLIYKMERFGLKEKPTSRSG